MIAAYYTSFQFFPAAALSIVFWAMLLIALIDLRTSTIPDVLTLVLVLAAIAYTYFTYGTFTVTGGLAGASFMGVLWLGSGGRWVGSGDVFLAGALGLFVGHWPFMALALMASYIVGAFVAIILLASRLIGRKAHVPFGPFLIFGALAAFFFGDAIFLQVFPY